MAMDTAPTRTTSDPTRNLWQWPMLLVGVGVFYAAWQGFIAVGPPKAADLYERSLQTLRSHVEASSPDAAALTTLLGSMAAESGRFPEFAVTTDYLIGSGYLRLADLATDPTQAREFAVQADRCLEQLTPDKLPNPEDDGPRLAYRAAKAHAGAGKFSGASDATLNLAARTLMFPPMGEHSGEATRLAGELFLSHIPPAYKEARKSFEKYLKSAGLSTPSPSLARAKLRLGELLLTMNEMEPARQWLAQIGPDAPADVLRPARVQLARMHMKEGAWPEAAKLWEQVLASPPLPPDLLGLTTYQLAVCRQKTGQPEAAVKLLEEVVKIEGPEKFAAIVKLTDLALEGRDPAARSASASRLATAITSLPTGEFASPYLPVNELWATVEKAAKDLPAEGSFEPALRLAESFGKVSTSGRDREVKADVLAAWGESLRKQNNAFAPTFKAAAEEYTALAKVADAPNSLKAERLYRASRYFLDAGDRNAQRDSLAKLVQLPEVPEGILGKAWLDYSEVLLASQEPKLAVGAINQAMANRTGGMAARYKLARLLLDSGDPARQTLGSDLLRQISGAEVVDPSEAEYRERALVELGQDALKAGRFAEAESTFRKQLAIHPGGSEANLARFLLGVCLLQQSARQPGVAEKPDDPKMRKEALDLFRALVVDIDTQRTKAGTLADRDFWLRTQASLRVLQALQQMERLGEVIATAAVVRRDCEGKVEELIALSMMYHAQKQANHPELAMRVLDEMRDVYRALAPLAFHGGGEYSREYWDRVWFNPPPAEGTPTANSPTSSAPVAPQDPAPVSPMRPLIPIGGTAPMEEPRPLIPIPTAPIAPTLPEPAGIPRLP